MGVLEDLANSILAQSNQQDKEFNKTSLDKIYKDNSAGLSISEAATAQTNASDLNALNDTDAETVRGLVDTKKLSQRPC